MLISEEPQNRGDQHGQMVCVRGAVAEGLERQTAWSIKKLVKTLRRYHRIAVQTGDRILHAGTPPDHTAQRRPQRRQGRQPLF
jgi:hypothetical protein